MTVYVDECRWSHRDHVWCHMVSDASLDELHDFARALGVPERGFHGDHYDLPRHVRDEAVKLGAVEVASRDIVRILSRAGLRLTADQRRRARHSAE
jgi:Protein of unknown function (DUF4031)